MTEIQMDFTEMFPSTKREGIENVIEWLGKQGVFKAPTNGYISVQSRAARWGSNAIGTISELLQQELPGLRGFSETSIKRMRIFYESWCSMFENRPSATDDLQNSIIPVGDKGHIVRITGTVLLIHFREQ